MITVCVSMCGVFFAFCLELEFASTLKGEGVMPSLSISALPFARVCCTDNLYMNVSACV